MVTLNTYGTNGVQYYGLSTDSKPTDAPNGAAFLEMNTGKVYFYDATNSTWIEWGA